MKPTDVESHERLITLNIIMSNKDGMVTATPCSLEGQRLPSLAYQAKSPYAAVQGAVRGMLR